MHYFYLQCQYYLHSANREQGLTRVLVLIDGTEFKFARAELELVPPARLQPLL